MQFIAGVNVEFEGAEKGKRVFLGDGNVCFIFGNPVERGNALFYIEGEVFEELTDRIFSEYVDGEYSCISVENNRLRVARDPLGTKTLFYAHSQEGIIFATDTLHIEKNSTQARAFPPGCVGCYDCASGTFSMRKVRAVHIGEKYSGEDVAKKELKKSIEEAVRKRVQDKRRVAVMFSGGVDSTLIASLASRWANVLLITVGAENSPDVLWAEKVAGEMGLALEVKILPDDEVFRIYERMKAQFPNASLMELELGMPVEVCAKIAKMRGIDVAVCGAGADELFGGYERYRRAYVAGYDVESMLYKDVRGIHEKDIDRTNIIALRNGVGIRYPFLDLNVVETAFRIPIDYKISNEAKKIVLRKVAEEFGVPREVCMRDKKAIQYGTGIHKVVCRHIKNKGDS
ncbi:MAG: asparagine synthase-related protein [Candidatus Micrarchaeia archaeon]